VSKKSCSQLLADPDSIKMALALLTGMLTGLERLTSTDRVSRTVLQPKPIDRGFAFVPNSHPFVMV
jgi:hypothetical protein